MAESPESTERAAVAPPPADALVRRLSARYLIVLAAVGILVAADQMAIQPLLVRMTVFAPAINTAGRQRMLSQRIAKASLALQASADPPSQALRRAELGAALDEWAAADAAMQHGDAALDLTPIRSPQLDQAWNELRPHFDEMLTAGRRLADPTSSPEVRIAALAEVVGHEAPFLATMERIVQLMQDQATAELVRLRALALVVALAIVGLLVGLGQFVVRPATRVIRQQVDLLEMYVADRTAELETALADLQEEHRERIEAEVRNRALAAQLAHADRVESLGGLAAGLAHELNQPLGAIANYAEACDATLADSWDEAARGRVQGYLQKLRQASLRAGAIIRRVRNFARPDATSVTRVEMNSLAAEVADFCRAEAARFDVELSLDLPPDRLVVEADSIQIQQVLVNLVQNGLQAMALAPGADASSSGELRRRLAIRLESDPDGVRVEVADSGPGFDVDPEALFSPFHTTKSDGLGIGLSICRTIVEQHRGRIWADSLPGRGAQFSFILPLAKTHVLERVS